jgi:hypothetical protein
MTLLIVLGLLLLLGPLRKTFVRHGRFSIAAIAGAAAGYIAGAYVMALAAVPPPLSFLIPAAMAAGAALGFGESCKAWCDRVLGLPEQPHDRSPRS